MAHRDALIAWFIGHIDWRHRRGLPWYMVATIDDILVMGVIVVLLSLFLFGYSARHRRHGLPWDTRNVTDDILVMGAIMVLLSLFLFHW